MHTALKHGIHREDAEHCAINAMAIDELDDDLLLYLGPVRSGSLLENITIVRDDGSELAIHAMTTRPETKYRLRR